TYNEHFPLLGPHSMLALSVVGLPEGATREEVRVEVGGFGSRPVYVGPWGGGTRAGQTQINLAIPPGLDPGITPVRMWYRDLRSNEYNISLSRCNQRW